MYILMIVQHTPGVWIIRILSNLVTLERNQKKRLFCSINGNSFFDTRWNCKYQSHRSSINPFYFLLKKKIIINSSQIWFIWFSKSKNQFIPLNHLTECWWFKIYFDQLSTLYFYLLFRFVVYKEGLRTASSFDLSSKPESPLKSQFRMPN